MTVALVLLGAYLLGSIPFAFLIARRWRGIDLRRSGSGNVGATNVMRTAGTRSAVAVVALDIIKGAAVVVLADRALPGFLAASAAGLAAIIGHIYPVWLRFRGGKGVATAFGVFGMLAPPGAIICLCCFLGTVWITRYVSLGSVIATLALAPAAYATDAPMPVVAAALTTAAMVVERHRSNLSRLQAGTESRVGQRA
jgi:acyl phosphate:glycerol-3-phosphate acyltransferase